MDNLLMDDNLILPSFLFDEKYKDLNNNDRCIFAILYSQLIKRMNEENITFINFSQEKIAEYTILSRKTVAVSLKKLIDYRLIKVQRIGNCKPCRIYITIPE